MFVNIKSFHRDFILPFKSTFKSAGFDITMPVDGIVPCGSDEVLWVSLGFATHFSEGYYAELLPRSGVGTQNGLSLVNTAGIIDSDYHSEWRVCLRCTLDKPLVFSKGDRLLQAIFKRCESPSLRLVNDFDINLDEQMHTGFGSTGR